MEIERKSLTQIITILIALIVAVSCSMIILPEEVSAASTTTKTTTTKKVTNSKVKMKHAVKKTCTKTKIKTQKYAPKTVKDTTEKKVVQQKIKKVTTVTKYIKKSKYKKIKKTVKITTKTTTTIKDKLTTEQKIQAIADIREAVPADVLNAFDILGFTIEINGDVNYQGFFSTKEHRIVLKSANSGVLLHEMGHFLSALKLNAAATTEWKNIYMNEQNSYVGSNKAYVISSANEYFAESYRDYVEKPDTLNVQRPETYAYIHELASNITQEDIDKAYSRYSWAW